MSDAALQQSSPTKRGRGRGRGGSARGATSARGGRKSVAGRRGRQKIYETSRAQAAHERQRDLKNAYATVAAAMKPALEDLADRNVHLLKSKFDAHQEVDEYTGIINFLTERLERRLSELDAKLKLSNACQDHEWNAEQDYTKQSYKNRWDDLFEDYLDAQLRRLDVLEELHRSRDPVDKLDDSWNYKSMTTEEAAEQGIYRKIYKGVEVPYPQLHPELAAEMNKSKAVRTPSKRKITDLLDLPIPKRPLSALDEKPGAAIPRHIGGLLSAVVPEEPVSQPPSPSPVDDNADVPSPPANEPAAGGRGRRRKHPPAPSPSMEGDDSEAGEDETMPPIPNGAAEPDSHGVRLINKRPRAGDMPNNRIMVPTLFEFDDHEIGFRDSTNDKSRGATKAKRRKFLNQPNSGAMFFDRNLCSYDATQYADGELDPDALQKHNLHPKYGIFLESSVNGAESPRPYQSGWKPTVFTTPDGEVLHTSRSIAKAKAEEAYVKKTLRDMMREFMAKEDMTEDGLYDHETERLLRQREENQLELERAEDQAQEEQDQQLGAQNIGLMIDAADALASRESQDMQEAQNSSPLLSRPSTMSRPYDAIRDVFGSSDLPPAVPTPAPQPEDTSAMDLLADMALHDGGEPQVASTQALDAEEAQQILIQMPDPVRPKQMRDPAELEQTEEDLVSPDYPDPENEPSSRRLAMPEHLVGRDQLYAVQQPQQYQDQPGLSTALIHYDNLGYREPGNPREQQQTAQTMQAPQPYLGQQGSHPPLGPPEPFAYRESEASYEEAQMTRPSQVPPRPSEERYVPVPNTDDALLDPQLFENGQRPQTSQLQAPQHAHQARQQQPPSHSGVLQQPQTSFFQTALNSPTTPTLQQGQSQPPNYHEASQQPPQYPGQPLAPAPRPPPGTEYSPGRTPFSNPNGIEAQPLPQLRPLHRGSGQLMAPAASGSQAPQHIMLTPTEQIDHYPPPPHPHPYSDHAYPMNGYGPDHPIMSTEQSHRPGYMAQPMMNPGQQPAPYPVQQPYPPPAPMGSQLPPQHENQAPSQTVQMLQSPPPFANAQPGVSSSPRRRSGSISSISRKNTQYREIKPAPRQTESWDNNGSELRTLMYNPYEGIRDYSATAPPPSHGPTQIRGWTHTTGSRKSRGKNSTDSSVDPSLAREEKK